MEVSQLRGVPFFNGARVLGEFFVVMDRRANTFPAASHELSIPTSERNLHRAQESEVGSLRWYDNDGPHKRQVDAIELHYLSRSDVKFKFIEVATEGEHAGDSVWPRVKKRGERGERAMVNS